MDRTGAVAGVYQSKYPCYGADSHVGFSPSKRIDALETDFGRLAVLLGCDAHFPEAWIEAEQHGPDMVVQLGSGSQLGGPAAFASMLGVFVVDNSDASGGAFFDLDGKSVQPERATPQRTGENIQSSENMQLDSSTSVGKIVEFDLDRTLVKTDDPHNGGGVFLANALTRPDLRGQLVVEKVLSNGAVWLLGSISPALSVQKELRRRGFQTLRAYRARARRLLGGWRESGQGVPPQSEVELGLEELGKEANEEEANEEEATEEELEREREVRSERERAWWTEERKGGERWELGEQDGGGRGG
eukprot:1923348-Rhodomonas_salina.1